MPKNLTGKFDIENKTVKLYTQASNNQFEKEQLCKEDNEYVISLTGCVLNLTQLKNDYNCTDEFDLIKKLFVQNKQKIVQILKGSYTVLVFDKSDKTLFLSNDLLSKKALYYYKDDKALVFGNKFSHIVGQLKTDKIPLTKDNLAAVMMLDEGFLWGDVTWANEVKYLGAFEYISVKDEKISIKGFEYEFASSEIQYDNALEKFNKLFTEAVALQFEKANQNGFKLLASLSAGMDSRATVLMAQKLGYADIDTFTYAQKGSIDQTIAEKIAKDHSFKNVFYPLDNAEFMLKVNEHFDMNEGEQSYCSGTGAYTMMHSFLQQDYSIVHTGLLGGEIMGDVQMSKTQTPVQENLSDTQAAKAFDEKEISKRYTEIVNKYCCNQQLNLQKHLRACQNFVWMASDRFESFSPFMEEEVYTFLYSLPMHFKYERKFYIDWMNKYLPNDYITTYTFGKMYSNGLLRKLKYLLRIIKGKIFGKSKYDMNPSDYWKLKVPNLNGDMKNILMQETASVKQQLTKEQKQYIASKTDNLTDISNAVTLLKAVKLLEAENFKNEKGDCVYENSF